ncbi:hypothetical protein ACFXJO_10605 [Streptomyces lavendulae]|uniref:hypothetical protein n=1 Tax=Streptomyces TaxID=1883 RepID=UPI0024734BFD|nr:hypothetical protein [Streptomyces sp. SPB4]
MILEFDREVTDEEVEEMQAKHNATSAFLEAAGGHHHHDDDDTPDIVDMGEVDDPDVVDAGEVDDPE